jgi:uncharacterized protein YicC (UPF0701 family)
MHSMTGLGRATAEDEERKVAVFIKTLNGKGLDVSIRANINLYEFEFEVRNKIKGVSAKGELLASSCRWKQKSQREMW